MHLFHISKCDDAAKTQVMLQALHFNKRGPFCSILSWNSIAEFGRKAHAQFQHIQKCDNIREISEHLAPKIRELESTLESILAFHDRVTLFNLTLTPTQWNPH